ncbi:MAG: exonuclease SbcCD subunit D C-terminal domain-containing protein [Betaproteobacteria bacterium]
MRILHTSDWHLGQTLQQFERSNEHTKFFAWLLNTLVAQEIDALLVAGDVFDNSNPSSASQTQLYRFLTEARQRVPHLKIVVTAGNHDSPGRLEAPAPLLSLMGACVIGQPQRGGEDIDFERLVVPLPDRHGVIAAWCIAMPFLRPGDVPRVEGAADPYTAGIAALYRSAFEYASSKRAPGQALIAMGHCHLSSAKASEDSERRIMIGGAEALSAAIFDAQIAYVALGHLHLAQKIGADPTRRYCGSPLPMSFSEIDYAHQVVVFDLQGERAVDIRELRIPRTVELLRVPKVPASLEQVLAELAALDPPSCDELLWPYLQARVLLDQPEPGLRAKIEAALQNKQVRLVRIETSYAPNSSTGTASAVSVDELNSLAPSDFFGRLYQHRFHSAPPPELMAAFTELVNSPMQEGAPA